MTFEQIPVTLTLDSITQFMPYLITAIPSGDGRCDADEIFIERHIDEAELRVDFSIQETIANAKQRAITLDLIKLAAMVQDKYLETLLSLGIDIENASHRTRQRVEIPFTLLDSYPGDTRIHYKLYTKRELHVL